ncbi:MAG: hypothetical protein ACPGC5_04925 [Flavobacteriaceae bacterium]
MRKKPLLLFIWANFGGFIGLIIGLLCGILYSFGGLLIDIGVSLGWLSAQAMETPGLSIGTLYAFGALIAMPVLFALSGWLAAGIAGGLFTLFKKILT